MINRFFKIINSKFSRFFKFVFFLRYLLVIFFISMVSFLVIPSFFDYKKKEEIIKLYLIKKYSLGIEKIDNVEYQFLPVPQLILENLKGNLYSEETNIKTQKLILYPKFLSLYNYKIHITLIDSGARSVAHRCKMRSLYTKTCRASARPLTC